MGDDHFRPQFQQPAPQGENNAFLNKVIANAEQEVRQLTQIKQEAEALNNSLVQEKSDLLKKYEQLQSQKEQLLKDIQLVQSQISVNNLDILKYKNLLVKMTEEVFEQIAQSSQQQQQSKIQPEPGRTEEKLKASNGVAQPFSQPAPSLSQSQQAQMLTQQQMYYNYMQNL